MKITSEQLESAVREVASLVPLITRVDIQPEIRKGKLHTDALVSIHVGDTCFEVVCETKAMPVLQPAAARDAIAQLLHYVANFRPMAIPMLMAPYVPPASRDLCKQLGVGYIDMEGNARLQFGGIFIEREASSQPIAEKRGLRSIFSPKAAQILRTLLVVPSRVWRVTELAEAARVSLGQVSNVRRVLIEREWASITPEGLFLSNPDALLNAWGDAYRPPRGTQYDFYTTLHGEGLLDVLRQGAAGSAVSSGFALASFSAAAFFSPYGRTGTQYFYASPAGLASLESVLSLAPAPQGANIQIVVPEDEGVFLDAVDTADGVRCTSAVQTYLDLRTFGERGIEAANQLRRSCLSWST